MIRYETLPRNKAIRKINKTLASDFIRAEGLIPRRLRRNKGY